MFFVVNFLVYGNCVKEMCIVVSYVFLGLVVVICSWFICR